MFVLLAGKYFSKSLFHSLYSRATGPNDGVLLLNKISYEVHVSLPKRIKTRIQNENSISRTSKNNEKLTQLSKVDVGILTGCIDF